MCKKHWSKRSDAIDSDSQTHYSRASNASSSSGPGPVASGIRLDEATDVAAGDDGGDGDTGGEVAAPRPSGIAAKMLYGAVRFYQKYLSALKMGSTCRFEPTCSAYALEAITTRGAFIGSVLTLVRLAKCGPWHPGGFDPVPLPASMRDADIH